MKRFGKQAAFSLSRAIESYAGPLCRVSTVESGEVDCFSRDEIATLANETSPTVKRLYNQAFVDPGFVPEFIEIGTPELRLINGCPVVVNPAVTVHLGDDIEQVWAVLGAGAGHAPGVDVMDFEAAGNHRLKLGDTCEIGAFFPSAVTFEPYCSVNNLVPMVLKGSVKTEKLTHDRNDRPELKTVTEAQAYFRLNGRFVRVSGGFTSPGEFVDIGGDTTPGAETYFAELILTTRSLEIEVSEAWEKEAAKRFNLYLASEKVGLAGDIERSTNREFKPVSWWEGSDGISGETGPLDRGTIAQEARDHWLLADNSIEATPAGHDAIRTVDDLGDPTRIVGEWDNTDDPENYNVNSADGFTVMTFIRRNSIPDDGNNYYIFYKDHLKLAFRDNKFRAVVGWTNTPPDDLSLSGRFEVLTNQWTTAGLTYSDRRNKLRTHTGPYDIVESGDAIDYDPDLGDTKVYLGNNSGSSAHADITIAAFVFLPYTLHPDTFRRISLFWQKKYGGGVSSHDSTSYIDDTGFELTDVQAMGHNLLQYIRKDLREKVEFAMIPEGLFKFQTGNQVQSFKCHITGREIQVLSNPPATLEFDEKRQKQKLVIPAQTSGTPAKLSPVSPPSTDHFYAHVTVRDVLNGEAQTFFEIDGVGTGKVSAYRAARDYNTRLEFSAWGTATSFPRHSYHVSASRPTRLIELFAHPLLNRSLSRYWPRSTSNYNVGGAIGRNRDWEERGIGRLIIENQRWARDCAIAGLLGLPEVGDDVADDETGEFPRNADGNVKRAIRFINWGWQFQVTDPEDPNFGGFESGDMLHSSSFFLEAAANILQCLRESDEVHGTQWESYLDTYYNLRPSDWGPKIRILAEWLGDPAVWNPEDDPSVYADTLEPFTHRFFLRGWGIWLAGHLLEDDAIKASGEVLLEMGMNKQAENGVNPERWAKDTSYQCVGCALLGQYYILSENEDLKARIPEVIRKAMESAEEEFNLVTGEVEFEGYRALTETARAGGRKTFDMRFYAYACLAADAVLDTHEFSEVGARVISRSERYHDLSTIAYTVSGDGGVDVSGNLNVDGYNESEPLDQVGLGSTIQMSLGNGSEPMEVFDIVMMASDSPLFVTAADLTAIVKIPARRYHQPINDPDASDPLFNEDESIPV
ncbi:hypothetical protein [Roseibacillus ishigakijimensis]|uniref:Uncharacterized protein n=1 Tax=Roseibacillus ishigakijimensis TaxID=454146 RepID=A0A934VLS7_9BACT|nr:hypothetical protein [Roseibacillus ishigakijimensis]MBK1834994.1 hypothetical protein [Roseibacillus ishigakijimensis]